MNQVTYATVWGGSLRDSCPLSFDNCYETLTTLFPILSFFPNSHFIMVIAVLMLSTYIRRERSSQLVS